MAASLLKEFRNRFHKDPQYFFFAPGRVNLIGEHLDYNGGMVMPCAITLGTYLAVSKNSDKRLRFYSMNYQEEADLHIQSSYSKSGKQWFNYPLGVIDRFLREGHPLTGLDLLYYGDLPIGAGLSSSASIEVLTAFALSELFNLSIPPVALAMLSKKVENEFIGVSCGIMDQFAVAMGKHQQAILLNCDTLVHQYLPFDTKDYALTIINTNKQRSLTESKYNQRFNECGMALRLVRQAPGKDATENLCDIPLNEFESIRPFIKDPVLERRARHVISENDRVKKAAQLLEKGDIHAFGTLMYASHESLRHDYEVSGKELDAIVDFCKTFPSCIGARMTGAGFGGCAIALIEKSSLASFTESIISDYSTKIGYAPSVFYSGIGDGVQHLTVSED